MPAVQILICGMHRSHTSVFAQWLHTCGLQIGDKFAARSTENPTGYWEDLEFVSLHEQILRENDLTVQSKSFESLTISEHHRAHARSLVSYRNDRYSVWGWKDPRTCLFYGNLWSPLLTRHIIVAVIRPYHDVITSQLLRLVNSQETSPRYKGLLSRFDGISRTFRTPKIQRLAGHTDLPNQILNNWITYNHYLVEMANMNLAESVLFVNPSAGFDAHKIIDHLNLSGCDLDFIEFSKVWESRKRA